MSITSQDLLYQVKISGKIPELLQSILQRQVLEETARELQIEISAEELQAGADRFRSINQLSTIAATQQWLADRLLTIDDFENLVMSNVLVEKVAQHLFAHKVAPYFHQHLLDYTSAIISEIVLTDKTLALELFYAIQEGDMSFADVARTYGQSLEIQRQYGYLGAVSRQHMSPEISAAVFAAAPPQLLKPIEVNKKVHLIFVEEANLPQLSAELHSQIMMQLFQEWLQDKIAIHSLKTVAKFELFEHLN
ncbi:peptidylprolyl isomerase [Chamaesiphon sp. VAR_69_metabat_338]|uniref:peptidylprolyl isomerase n=1 Tax=Chamaesiphon sp. VAR_69_metabat_338 TaxID=2964704 RepID=UPI00286DD434|nr:peptidylprolyl isomerase [Chamaesiphon sp. VAR_69_metabat_338]